MFNTKDQIIIIIGWWLVAGGVAVRVCAAGLGGVLGYPSGPGGLLGHPPHPLVHLRKGGASHSFVSFKTEVGF